MLIRFGYPDTITDMILLKLHDKLHDKLQLLISLKIIPVKNIVREHCVQGSATPHCSGHA